MGRTWRIRGLSLFKRIWLLAFAAELAVVTAAALMGLYVFYTDKELLAHAMEGTLEFSAHQIEQAVRSVSALSDQIYSNSVIQRELGYVASDEETPGRRSAYHVLYNQLLSMLQQYHAPSHIRFISLITRDFTVTAGDFTGVLTDEMAQALCAMAEGQEGRPVVSAAWSEQPGVMLCRAVRRISPFTLDTLGVLVICMDQAAIVRDTTTFNQRFEECLYMLGTQDDLIYCSPELAGDPMARQALASRQREVSLGDHHYFAQRGVVPGYGWNTVCMVRIDEQIATQNRALLLFFGILTLALLATGLLSRRTAGKISGELASLVDKMRAFRGQGLPSATGDAAPGTDEIAQLHRHFDRMAAEITELIQAKYVGELLARDAQLRALEAQVNPHFLYNVLDTINWRARMGGLTDVSEIVDALARYLRESLNRSRKQIALREELGLVDCYITIQRYRFEDRLQYVCDVPQALMEVEIPKLVIQPLVENAVKYAVETSIDDSCQIVVRALVSEGLLVIDVMNTGSEMEDDLLEQLRTGRTQAHGFGIGLMNIDERMRLTFGPERGLRLFNADGYAVCRLTLPYPAPGKEEEHASNADRR